MSLLFSARFCSFEDKSPSRCKHYGNGLGQIAGFCLFAFIRIESSWQDPEHRMITSFARNLLTYTMSEPPHPLKTLLQLQLATDASTVLHLPWVVSTLSPACFTPSSHLQKWATRVNSLIHSKDPGARWAGLSLALQTALHSRETLMENAQGWLGVALPLFSVRVFIP